MNDLGIERTPRVHEFVDSESDPHDPVMIQHRIPRKHAERGA